jgi:pimeloyl-ACP methyl ester carboxylesterase
VPPEKILSYLAHDQSVLTKHLPAEMGASWQAARERESGNFFKLVANGLLDPGFSRWLHRVTVPTLIVWGNEDRITPVEQSEAWIRHIPGARLHRYPNAGHVVLDEVPGAAKAIADFLRE